MFKKLYAAGQEAAQNTLQKFIWSKTMTPEEKTEAAGMLGIVAGGLLQNIAIGGMLIGLVVAAVAGSGLTLGAFAGIAALGTTLAGVGIFGKGMADKGDEMNGNTIRVAKEFRKEMAKTLWNDLRGKKPQSGIFAPGAKAAADEFTAAAAGAAVKTAAPDAPAPKASAPEMR